ncbi:MAG: site-specific DNA-methyltransferase [Chloroflexi bacterium]|nr:site-specific DNA-methyltransferase [Chloroflexota bacterium]
MAIAKSLWELEESNGFTSATIENIDCRLGMMRLEDNHVSLILTDPPYFIDGMDNSWNTQKLRKRVKPGVVGALPAGMKFSSEQGQNLQKFLYPIAKEWMRILRPGGFALVFSQNRLVHRTAIALEEAGFEIRDALLWKYEGQAKAFTQDHFVRKSNLEESEKERLIQKLGGRKTPQLKPQGEMIVLAQAPREGTFVQNWDKWETGLIDVSDPYIDKGRFPGTVISVPKPKKRFGHMTAKPVDLLRHLIRIFCAPESLVFDPFAGSGSTGVAALLEGREFLGFEIEDDMAKRANDRIGEHCAKFTD